MTALRDHISAIQAAPLVRGLVAFGSAEAAKRIVDGINRDVIRK